MAWTVVIQSDFAFATLGSRPGERGPRECWMGHLGCVHWALLCRGHSVVSGHWCFICSTILTKPGKHRALGIEQHIGSVFQQGRLKLICPEQGAGSGVCYSSFFSCGAIHGKWEPSPALRTLPSAALVGSVSWPGLVFPCFPPRLGSHWARKRTNTDWVFGPYCLPPPDCHNSMQNLASSCEERQFRLRRFRIQLCGRLHGTNTMGIHPNRESSGQAQLISSFLEAISGLMMLKGTVCGRSKPGRCGCPKPASVFAGG